MPGDGEPAHDVDQRRSGWYAQMVDRVDSELFDHGSVSPRGQSGRESEALD
jgi:hypothetical protein